MSKMKKAASAPRRAIQHWRILRENHVYLLRNLSSGDILPYLYQEHVLNLDEYNKLDGMQDQERNKALLIKIEQRNVRQFRQFLLSLDKNDQSFVIDHLENQTGLPLRKEFKVNNPIHLDPGIIEKLEKDKQDMESKLKELEGNHERELKEMQSKLKENETLMQAQGKETDRSKKELREEVSRLRTSIDSLNRKWERKEEDLKTKIKNHEERIRTLESQKGGRSDGSQTDDEKLSNQQEPVITPAEIETFFGAVRQGKLDEVRRLLEQGRATLDCRGKDKRNAVMEAVVYRQEHIFDFFLKTNCDLSAVDDNNNNVFHYACVGGSKYIVKELFEKHKIDIECRGLMGRTALTVAVDKGHLPLVQFLQNKGADINTVDDYDYNILHVACLGGHVEMVKYVLSLNITDIECRGLMGRTALTVAVDKGHLPLVQFLQNKGADINTVDDDGNNILHVACLGGHVDMVKYVLSLNITDIECRGKYGRTPLMWAVEKGHLPLVQFLQNKGADINTVDDDGNNILHVACLGGDVEMVKYVLSLNITDIECRGQCGMTPLMWAVEKGHLPLVQFLQNTGADIKTVNDDGNNILHVACLGGDVEMVKYVLSLNITDIECRGQCGMTPLMWAVEKGHLPLVQFLQNKGADIKTVDDDGDNILHGACLGDDVEMVKYVLSLNITDIECRGLIGRTPMMCAVESGHLPLVEFLQNKGADINTVDDDGNNILHVACLGGHVDMVKYVLSLNITDIECRGQCGRTPLMWAVEKGHLPLVQFLQNKGADINTVDDEGDNILHMACLGGDVEMVKYVLSLNITDIECRGLIGRTPMMCAVESGHLPLVELLQNEGADINTVNDEGDNILHMACIGGNVEMVKYLVTLQALKESERRKNKHGATPLQVAQSEGYDDVVALLKSRK